MEPRVPPDWEERIRAAGLRVTRPRLLVLDTLAGRGGHQSADDVWQALIERGHTLARTTVYNVLNDLADARVILQADLGPGSMLFEYAGNWHHHFRCRRCRRVFDIPAGSLAGLRVDTGMPGAQVEATQVVVRGLCPDCAAG